ncbi:putative transporter [Pseudocercospora fuligena]|uniref:Putative transporter n=1 Tax=Pseudocercospora fuligena TaxID=685502 RepID=A0A8H6RG49_9PEZI|nr:putative transporter [Pseudocercospora fuligena]
MTETKEVAMAAIDRTNTKISVKAGEIHEVSKRIDPAWSVVGQERVQYSEEEGRRVLRCIDGHLLPMLMWVHCIQFADKVSLNYASVMGLRTDTHLNPNSQQFSWVGAIFYAGYIFWEFPTTYLLRRLPLGKYTSSQIVLWGAVLTCHAAATNYASLLSLRFFLGAFEATVTPAFVLLVSVWYQRGEQAKRVNAWLCCNGIATMIMAPFAYGLSGAQDTAIQTWRIMFLILGLLTVVTGVFLVFYMPDNQNNARFLNSRQKQIAVERIRVNFQGIGNREWNWAHFREAFRDPRTYLYVLFSLLMNIPNGGITTFGSLIIKSFGFGDRLALLLQMPGGFVDVVCKLFFGYVSDRLVGGIMMITIPQSAPAALLLGYYFISCAGASRGLVMTMISNNTVGYTKKATVNALQILAYGAGNWIGPQTFRSGDAPEYLHGKLMVAIMYGAAAVVSLMIRLVNIIENKRRDKESVPAEPSAEMAFQDKTDFEQRDFRFGTSTRIRKIQ